MKYSKDWHLMIIVLIFIAADVIILVVAESVQASRFVPTLREDREFPSTITVCLCTIVMHGLIVFPGVYNVYSFRSIVVCESFQ